MSERELLEAAVALLPHIKASTDKLTNSYVDKFLNATDAERLRQQADAIEARDAAILRFRAAVAAINEAGTHE
jgi:hypothetical protein